MKGYIVDEVGESCENNSKSFPWSFFFAFYAFSPHKIHLLVVKEILDMTQRLEVAELLTAGKNYQEVCKETGASTATISRVSKCLNYGAGGYSLVINKKGKNNG